MRLLWDERAWDEYLYWQTQDKKTLKRINLLLKDIQRSTFEGIGEPEPLKDNLSGWWSRRIDSANRRLTPAHAGKRRKKSEPASCTEAHPRPCGEKSGKQANVRYHKKAHPRPCGEKTIFQS